MPSSRIKLLIKYLKVSAVLGGSGVFIYYHIDQSYRTINRIVSHNAITRERNRTPEYIYIEDPSYESILLKEQDKELKQAVGLARIWKNLQHSLAFRLLWMCKHGSKEQQNVALVQLAAFKNKKDWEYLKLAQAMDPNTAVRLAHTQGADLRYFMAPPVHIIRAALTDDLFSFKMYELLSILQAVHPHICIKHFLNQHFTNMQGQAVEYDDVPTKPESITERDLSILCLDAVYHHLSLFSTRKYEDDISAQLLLKNGLLSRLAEITLRYPNDPDVDLVVLNILTILSVHSNLLIDFYQNGLIKVLARLVRSCDIKLSSSAAVCLSNLSGEFCYRPGLYLLHPLYRTTTPYSCDTLLVHGLRGGVFVTWRQRDRKCGQSVVLLDFASSKEDISYQGSLDSKNEKNRSYLDPELDIDFNELIRMENEALLSDIEVVLHDLPISSKRESHDNKFIAKNKLQALLEEDNDHYNYTHCWPSDWLPNDCKNLRILGANYLSSLSDWLDRCPLKAADIETRANELTLALIDAGVGSKNIPIVWLAHSMGGLIIKKLLIDVSNNFDEKFLVLCKNTKAILFFSTPHKGSALATMPRAAAAVLWPSSDVKQLEQNSPDLLDMHKAFIQVADKYNWETISFAETKPTLVTSFKVPVHFVEPFSADLGRGVFYEMPLDHLSICKPATRQSILYTTVLDVILRVSASEKQLQQRKHFVYWTQSCLKSIFNIGTCNQNDKQETL